MVTGQSRWQERRGITLSSQCAQACICMHQHVHVCMGMHTRAGRHTGTHTCMHVHRPRAPTCHMFAHMHTHTHARLATELIHSIWNLGLRGDLGVQTRILCRGLREAGGDCRGRRLCVGTAYPILTGPSPLWSPPRLQPAVCTWVGFGYSFSHPLPWKNGPIQAACSLTQAACNPLPPRAQGPESLGCHFIAVPGRRSQFSQRAKRTWAPGPMGPLPLWVPHVARCP